MVPAQPQQLHPDGRGNERVSGLLGRTRDSEVINVTIDRSAQTVLVVDGNAATRHSTSRLLRAAGFRTAEAGSGSEAIEKSLQASALVLDVHLPDIDGFEVCRQVRANPATAMLPVVHLSAARIRDEDRVAGLDAGADGYLVHPVEPAVLVATLQALIRARLAEERLRRSEQRFRAIYDQAQSGIALLDGEGRFTDVNPAIERMLGRGRSELVGRKVSSLAPPEWQASVQERLVQDGAARGPGRSEFPLLTAQGRPVHLEWSISPHVEPASRIAIAIDVSERHELEQRRLDVLEREQAARVMAEKHSRTKDDFIAVLSHELRTPLNAIIGWVHILKRRGTTPEGVKGLDAIERNVKTQARIISDILDVSRINSGKLRLDRQWVDPAELILGSLDSLGASLEERRLAVELDVGSAHQPVWMDAGRYQQVFWNLMTNAIKFSPEGGRIDVSLHREGARLVLQVRDAGPGIAPEFLPHLFERFTQSGPPRNRTHGGLGLGLSIVKHIVDLHGGSVAAASEGAGKGTLMRVELPTDRTDGAPPEAPDSAGGPGGDPTEVALDGLQVLLVEDDQEASEMMTLVLAERGAVVRAARDCDAALEALRAARPDVMVSDIGLPGRDGYELAAAVRAGEKETGGERLPLIALTAFGRPEDRRRAVEAGFDLHLAKPIKPFRLLEALRRYAR